LPENLSSCIQIGFLGKGSSSFRPSINLAIEEVDVDLKQYLKAVKEIHLTEPKTTWRDLGKFKTLSGEGRLTEISNFSPLGEVKILQMILIKDQNAYILTGAASKVDFLRFQDVFVKSFQSLQLTKDLFAPLPIGEKENFETFFTSLQKSNLDPILQAKQWDALQTMVAGKMEMGNYWQFLILKMGREKIYH
jgi:hypothetical protein